MILSNCVFYGWSAGCGAETNPTFSNVSVTARGTLQASSKAVMSWLELLQQLHLVWIGSNIWTIATFCIVMLTKKTNCCRWKRHTHFFQPWLRQSCRIEWCNCSYQTRIWYWYLYTYWYLIPVSVYVLISDTDIGASLVDMTCLQYFAPLFPFLS